MAQISREIELGMKRHAGCREKSRVVRSTGVILFLAF
jgi:hypothetical protein